ncbi:ammonium transporter [Rugosimonospora acidiphila]|uniref:ammonium transporter n=1 Tax=Rugosimonospora acidiphila TaxID=556531 RepID=UPI0031E88BB2
MLADPSALDTGNTTWLLVSSALVLLMTPGLAFFYGGLNRSKSVLNMMMMSFSCIGLVSVLWLIYGFSFAFGTNSSSGANEIIGSFTQYLGNKTFVGEMWLSTGIPTYVVLAFQMMFAVITVALISGSISDRTKFSGWLVFAFGWFTIVYVPVAHWVWGGGFIATKIGALDFAGGTAVHINAGSAALGLALVLGRRVGWPKESFKPHNVPFVALGAGLLWFGWFGFNAGSELTADNLTALAFVNTQVATAAGFLGWIIVEWVRKNGRPTMVGGSSGAVAGLVAITPACAYIAPYAAVLLGLVAGGVCAMAVSVKYKLGFDDSLDVVGVHFTGGWIGSLWIGLFGSGAISSYVKHNGLFYGGGVGALWRQALASAIVSVFSFGVAYLLGTLINKTIGLRTSREVEVEGIDVAEHAESAYEFSPAAGGGGAGAFALAGVGAPKSEAPKSGAPKPAVPGPAAEPDPESEKVAG